MSDYELSRCPHCHKRGTYLEDDIHMDGLTIQAPYCGFCGRNWPKHVDRMGKPIVRPIEAEA